MKQALCNESSPCIIAALRGQVILEAKAFQDCMTILAGKGGGSLAPGRYLKYNGVVMSNLWLSLMDRMGVEVERHGDSTGRLLGLDG